MNFSFIHSFFALEFYGFKPNSLFFGEFFYFLIQKSDFHHSCYDLISKMTFFNERSTKFTDQIKHFVAIKLEID